ncbi:MAG: hypothetical protein A2X56_11985 [Nitrospirae bacterium GWC2_57_13]|jgi:hypothetical protein|nr:MAG: hypothetical protein A2X56_11985 [Nitrospirae bacterium GWC2_57_13]OGW41800.1 MAG: hypothetical protein A2X57_09090 [Nitrospirae bacterium GWD2_57_8]HAR45595.1 hypothetical protein [Nitrospiraceae bacterium]HAS53070.1 hypothetical protein [Nitrospiraceae bacterium]
MDVNTADNIFLSAALQLPGPLFGPKMRNIRSKTTYRGLKGASDKPRSGMPQFSCPDQDSAGTI